MTIGYQQLRLVHRGLIPKLSQYFATQVGQNSVATDVVGYRYLVGLAGVAEA